LDMGGPSNSCGKTNTCHARSHAKETVPLLVKMGKAALLSAFSARSFTFAHVFVGQSVDSSLTTLNHNQTPSPPV
jgi:hypothetical protein